MSGSSQGRYQSTNSIGQSPYARFRAVAAAAALGIGGGLPAPANANEENPIMTGKVMLERMPSKEFEAFVTGMVEGMAYARFRKDTVAAGERSEGGMNCILNWYHKNPKNFLVFVDAIRHHEQHTAWVVLGSLLKRECGE